VEDKQAVTQNAFYAVLQVVLSGVMLFLFYRYLYSVIGIEQVGIWSLILAMTSLSSIANLGFGGSLVKYVAQYHARGDQDAINDVVATAVITVGIAVATVLILAYPFAEALVGMVVQRQYAERAASLLPYAIVSLWIGSLGNMYAAVLEGYHLAYLKSVIFLAGQALNLLLSMLMVSHHGLFGLAYAQIIQAAFVVAATMIVLKTKVPSMRVVPGMWKKERYREMKNYGFNVQVNSVAIMLYDPITKALLSKYGDISIVGFFEMANRTVLLFRAVLVNANRVLVPTISRAMESVNVPLNKIYSLSYELILYLSVPIFAGLIAFAPSVAHLWTGAYNDRLSSMIMILSLGWFVNILAGPAYFMNMGTGDLSMNTISHVVIGLGNLLLGLAAGVLLGGQYIVWTWTLSLGAGSLMIPISYQRKNSLPLSSLLPATSRMLALSCTVGAVLSLLVYHGYHESLPFFQLLAGTVLVYCAIIFPSLWKHPARSRLFEMTGHLRGLSAGKDQNHEDA